MEPTEIKIERMMFRFYHKIGVWLLPLLLIAAIVLLLASCRSTTAAYGTQRTTRDSVAIKYKTVLRDSIRIKDSVRIVTKTKVRDSVVLRIDNATGKVVSRESYHSSDTNTDRDHVAEAGEMVSKADSVGYERVKTDSANIVKTVREKPTEVKKTHYWKIYWLGMLSGILLAFGWKYRKVIIGLMKKNSLISLVSWFLVS